MTDTKVDTRLPHWDMTTVFPSLDSSEFTTAYDALLKAHRASSSRWRTRRASGRPTASTSTTTTIATFEDVLTRLNDIGERSREITSYLYSFITTEAQNDAAQARNSELQMNMVPMSKVGTRFVAWIGSLDVEALIERSQLARDHAFALRKAKRDAEMQMSEVEEDLASSLVTVEPRRVGTLHGNVTSRVMADLEQSGRHRRAAADGAGARAGRRPRPAGPRGGVRRPDADVADGRGAARRRAQQHQGLGERAERAARLRRLARSRRSTTTTSTARRSRRCRRRASSRSRTSAAT